MSYSQTTDGGTTWPQTRQPDSVPRTETGSTSEAAWNAAGWYEDTYDPSVPTACRTPGTGA